ncbi:hypothetical protein J1N35_010134 [Gossypium stocksii]|uniref:Uncharacterized protein n=1 Tax=Gossypium stocksii TaxID=47602 RepID=A0A9D4ACH2_9ROSI|nr:hypothetical protein J1N35_010134 [Gossypium stocksii]
MCTTACAQSLHIDPALAPYARPTAEHLCCFLLLALAAHCSRTKPAYPCRALAFVSIMPRKRTRASAQIDKTQNKFHYEEVKVRYESLSWELFCEKRPSVDEELVREFYANLTSSELTKVPVRGIKTIDVGKIILREMWNCAVRRFGPVYFPFTITIQCLKAKILANVKKTGYSQATITDWDLYRVAGDSILQQ